MKEINLIKAKESNYEYQNIYYIILDGMIDLNKAEKQKILNKKNTIFDLGSLNLRYKSNSFANYDTSHLSISTIFDLNYPVKEDSLRYSNLKSFFPLSILKKPENVPLVKFLINNKFHINWYDNYVMVCHDNLYILCRNEGFISNFIATIYPFYNKTPLDVMYNKFIATSNMKQYSLKRLTKDIQSGLELKSPHFTFVHNMSPHTPYNRDKNCNTNNQINSNYKNEYLCTISDIKLFLNVLDDHDPNALIIIHGDHGWYEDLLIDKSQHDLFRASIFNAYRIPSKCQNLIYPKTPVNIVRFVLNCNFETKFKYLDEYHYKSFEYNEDKTFNTDGFGKVKIIFNNNNFL